MKKFVYICAAARSGSTMLDMLLGGHSRGASLGEFSFLGKAISLDQTCGCGAKVIECSCWQLVFDRIVADRAIDLRDTPYALRQWDTNASVFVDARQQTHRYLFQARVRSALCRLRYYAPFGVKLPLPSLLKKQIKNAVYLYQAILREWDKDFIMDSSKNMNKALALYEGSKECTCVILLIRDGRGVFYSRRSSGFSREESLGGWLNYYSHAINLIGKNIPSADVKIVKYEELASDAESVLSELCTWLGVPFEQTMVDLSHGERHLVNGNKARFHRDKGIKLDERWKTELKGDELDWFMSRGGKLNRKLGYE